MFFTFQRAKIQKKHYLCASLYYRMERIQMLNLQDQYLKIKSEIDAEIQKVIDNSCFINGPAVCEFESQLARYVGAKCVVACGNGTDALQIALMSLGLQPGDEVVTVPFTFIATAEVIRLLGLKPVFVDVRPDTFNMDVSKLESVITPKTKAVIPVHLFGQCVDMESLLRIARKYHLAVVEDACQAIGAEVTFSDGSVHKAGTMGDIGCTSFFPSKNLGCFGDGGALFFQDEKLAASARCIAHHGSVEKYHHQRVGVNSRLDTIQAAVLKVKLTHLDEYTRARQEAAAFYTRNFSNSAVLETPAVAPFSTHVFHQYTLKLKNVDRLSVMTKLSCKGIPSAVYYPIPIHLQEGYADLGYSVDDFPVSEKLSQQVLSLPMHTELTTEQQSFIVESLLSE